MRTSVWARSTPVLILLALAACGGGTGPAGAGGGSGGHGGTAGSGGAAGGSAAGGSAAGGSAAGGSAAGGSRAGAGGTTGAAGAAGTAGIAGAGGAAGMGGSAAGAGGASDAPAGGRGGNSGTGGGAGGSGAAGLGAAGGSGASGNGAAGAGSGGVTGASPLKLEYASTSSAATTFNVKLTVLGPSTPNVGAIKFRYFFTDDSGVGAVNPVIDMAKWTIASTGTSIDLRGTGGCGATSSTRKIPASSYADVGCSLASPTAVGDVITFAVHFDPAQNPANDYSFIDSGGALVANDHMLVTVNGVVVSGTAAP